jgi:hypothetical protein
MRMGKDVQLIFDAMGVAVSDVKESPFHHSSVRIMGSGLVLKGAYTEMGSSVLISPDGSQVFFQYEAKAVGPDKLKGSWTLIGGTGKFADITGKGMLKRQNVPKPAMEKTVQGYLKCTGDWKLAPPK